MKRGSQKPFCFSMLPVELLTHIFTLFSGDQVPDNGSLPYPAWLPITHVCCYWRTVALNHAQLWTSITPGLSLHWINVYIERSRTMLMDFNLLVHPPVMPDTRPSLPFKDIIQLLEGFTRVRSLCLTGITRVITPIMHSLRRSLPVQSLSLCISSGAEIWFYLMICLGERHRFAAYSLLQIVTLSHLAGYFTVSPISRPKCRSHPLISQQTLSDVSVYTYAP